MKHTINFIIVLSIGMLTGALLKPTEAQKPVNPKDPSVHFYQQKFTLVPGQFQNIELYRRDVPVRVEVSISPITIVFPGDEPRQYGAFIGQALLLQDSASGLISVTNKTSNFDENDGPGVYRRFEIIQNAANQPPAVIRVGTNFPTRIMNPEITYVVNQWY